MILWLRAAVLPLVLVILIGLMACLPAAPALAQAPPGTPASLPQGDAAGAGADAGADGGSNGEQAAGGEAAAGPSLEELIATLENEETRETFLARLRALAEAEQETDPAGDIAVVDAALEELRDRQAMLRSVFIELTASWRQLPELGQWLQAELSSPFRRARWVESATRLTFVLAVGLIVHSAVTILVRRGMPAETPRDAWRRFLHRMGAIAILGLVTVALLFMLDHPRIVRSAGRELLTGLVVLFVFRATIELLLGRYKRPARIVPLREETALDLRRALMPIGTLAILGYFSIRAGDELGLPRTIAAVLEHILFFFVAVLVIALILRFRTRVRETMIGWGDHLFADSTSLNRSAARRLVPYRFLASSWHILAILWVLVTFAFWALQVPDGFTFLVRATLLSVVVVVVARLLLIWLDRQFASEPAAASEAEDLLPGVQDRVHRYANPLRILARFAIFAAAVLALLQIWQTGVIAWLETDSGRNVLGIVVTVAIIIVLTVLACELVDLIIGRYLAASDEDGRPVHSNRARTLASILRNAAIVVTITLAIFLVLSEIGVEAGPLLAGAGVVGLAIGFGSQRLVQDLITGVFILLGDTVRVGDVVMLAGNAGVVEAMSMRTVTLRGYDGNVHTVPYSSIDVVTNMTKDYSFAVLDVAVAYRENVDEVMDILRRVDSELRREWPFRRLILAPLEIAGVDRLGSSEVLIKIRSKVAAGEQWTVRRELNRRIKLRFDAEGIEIPFPHQTVYFGSGKDGSAPPLQIERTRRQILERENVAGPEQRSAP